MAFKENKISLMPLIEWMKTLAMTILGLRAGQLLYRKLTKLLANCIYNTNNQG